MIFLIHHLKRVALSNRDLHSYCTGGRV